VEALHRHNDEALSRIIEPAQGGVAEPINRAFKGYDRIGIIGLIGSSMIRTSPPRPVSVPFALAFFDLDLLLLLRDLRWLW
jgi:hypothetical protein